MISPAILILILTTSNANVIKHKVTPVEKVIELLEKLSAETAAEAQEDAKTYDEVACFCKEQADDKLYAIEKSRALIERQTTKIKKLGAEIEELNAKIQELQTSVDTLKKEQAEADKVRAQEFAAYQEEDAKTTELISAVEGAIKALEESKGGMKDAKLNLDQAKQAVSAKQFKEILGFLEVAKSTAPGKPAAYQYRSNDIISTLKGLLKTFKQNKVDADTQEADLNNDYQLKKQAKENTIEFTEKDIDEAKTLSAAKEKEKQETEQAKAEEEADMNADQAFLDELTSTCEQKAKDFDQRSNARTGELTAVTKAIEILKSGVQPNYGANKKLTGFLQNSVQAVSQVKEHRAEDNDEEPMREALISFVQDGAPESFIQLRGMTKLTLLPRVLTLLHERARELHSPALSILAVKIQAGSGKDHFVKVRQLIKDMIAKLEADAEAEADQKEFCDKGMKEAITQRDKAIGSVETLTAKIAELTSEITSLAELIYELTTAIADLRKAIFEETELRSKEKADNTKTLDDSNAGLDAVKAAIKVLKEFYEGAFTQFTPAGADRDGNTVKDLAPAGQSGTYHGNQDAAKGIFGMLEVILSDFERTIKKTSEEEDEAQAEYEKSQEEAKKSIEEKSAAKKQAEEDKETKESDKTDAETDLNEQKELLQLALDKLKELEPMCVSTGQDHEERRRRQKQEIESLKEALAILSEI